ncbi:MAG: hypothetical protein QM759_14705 [Terricaulis sp.]
MLWKRAAILGANLRSGYDWQIYRDLCEAQRQVGVHQAVEQPFVSVAGPNYGANLQRVLYVGKSTWASEAAGKATGSREEFERSLAWSSYWLGRQATPSTAFWLFGAELVRAIRPTVNDAPTSYLAWSNLAKVAQVGAGAPDSDIAKAMHRAECAALTAELKELEPELVVLVTSDAVWNVATEVFGRRDEMNFCFDDGTWVRPDPRGFKLYWTRHPQGASLEWRAEHANRIATLLSA